MTNGLIAEENDMKNNCFNTLWEALDAESLDLMIYGAIKYGETFTTTIDDGTKYGHYVSIFRCSQTGRYERPIHYARG